MYQEEGNMEINQTTLLIIPLDKSPEASNEVELRSALARVPGVVSAEKGDASWTVTCYEGAVSKTDIEDIFIFYGAEPAREKGKKGNFISRWLESLGESNKRRFGSDTPDCCKLSSKQGVHGG
jgi:hypothetical protein